MSINNRIVTPILYKRGSHGVLERVTSGRFVTNLCLASEDLSSASWTKSLVTISSNAVVAPIGGVQTADTLIEDVGGTFHLVRQNVTIAASSFNTFSFFAQAAGRTSCRLQLSNTLENTGTFVDFNFSTGVTSNLTNFGTGVNLGASIARYPNSWFRVSLCSRIDTSSTSIRLQILLSNPIGTTNYAGDGTSGLTLWGMQLETNTTSPSEYVPTGTFEVT